MSPDMAGAAIGTVAELGAIVFAILLAGAVMAAVLGTVRLIRRR